MCETIIYVHRVSEMKKARLLPEERRNAIFAMLEQEGRVFCSELADTFGVSEMTIRRDLTYLERLGGITQGSRRRSQCGR